MYSPWKELVEFMSGMSDNHKLTIILVLILSVTGCYTYSAHLDSQVEIAVKTLKSEETKLTLKTMQFLAEGHLEDERINHDKNKTALSRAKTPHEHSGRMAKW